MNRTVRNLLDRLPYISSLRKQVDEQGRYPAGHFYSPIPNKTDVAVSLDARRSDPLLDINLNRDGQRQLVEEYTRYYEELPFPEQPDSAFRYFFDQNWFCYADAIFLYSFLRHFRPRRVIEAGSGYSSAVMLDTIELFLDGETDVTLIEPNPERLLGTLKEGDSEKVTILENRIQDVSPDVFGALEAGDLLFVDSSHVVKCGSDVHRILFEIMPSLPVGAFVHFHDVFYPFDYPEEWLVEGRYWNEDYFLRAFLSYNETWEIVFFNHYAGSEFRSHLKEHMPLCLKNSGGSLYLKRVK